MPVVAERETSIKFAFNYLMMMMMMLYALTVELLESEFNREYFVLYIYVFFVT